MNRLPIITEIAVDAYRKRAATHGEREAWSHVHGYIALGWSPEIWEAIREAFTAQVGEGSTA